MGVGYDELLVLVVVVVRHFPQVQGSKDCDLNQDESVAASFIPRMENLSWLDVPGAKFQLWEAVRVCQSNKYLIGFRIGRLIMHKTSCGSLNITPQQSYQASCCESTQISKFALTKI